MEYSEKLDGFWEEGYHYYLEIHKDRLTVRHVSVSVDELLF